MATFHIILHPNLCSIVHPFKYILFSYQTYEKINNLQPARFQLKPLGVLPLVTCVTHFLH